MARRRRLTFTPATRHRDTSSSNTARKSWLSESLSWSRPLTVCRSADARDMLSREPVTRDTRRNGGRRCKPSGEKLRPLRVRWCGLLTTGGRGTRSRSTPSGSFSDRIMSARDEGCPDRPIRQMGRRRRATPPERPWREAITASPTTVASSITLNVRRETAPIWARSRSRRRDSQLARRLDRRHNRTWVGRSRADLALQYAWRMAGAACAHGSAAEWRDGLRYHCPGKRHPPLAFTPRCRATRSTSPPTRRSRSSRR